MTSITNNLLFEDGSGCKVFFTVHENGEGFCISTHSPEKKGVIVGLFKNQAIELRDWLNKEYPVVT